MLLLPPPPPRTTVVMTNGCPLTHRLCPRLLDQLQHVAPRTARWAAATAYPPRTTATGQAPHTIRAAMHLGYGLRDKLNIWGG